MKCAGIIIAALLVTGCGWFGPAKISSGGTTVQGVRDAGKPATLSTSTAGETVSLPQGSKVTVTETAATSAAPAVSVTEITPAGPSEWRKTESTVRADTGTVDTSVATRKIAAAESRPLLYASIAATLAACFFVWASYPTPAICCGVAAGVFFLAWQVSGLPSWFWALGLAAICIGGALYLGHERGEKDSKPKTNLPQ